MDLNTEYEREHLKNLAAYQKQVQDIYFATIDEVFRASIGLTITKPVFRITDYPALNNAMTRVLEDFYAQMAVSLVNGIKAEFDLSDRKNTALFEQRFGKRSRPYFYNNQRIYTDFIARRTGIKRLTLSDRVWKLTHQLQAEIEQALYVGLSEGQSAAKMAQEAKRFLKEPDRLFRRVRNAQGKLVLSKNAKLYKPGQGVYRSSFKNALRLTAQTNNSAYRTADHERWKKTKFILGVEVKLSKNHPTNNEAVRCDLLVGPYPPDYKHTGFHIRCLCYAVPMLPTAEEYDKYEEAILAGKEKQFQFSDKVQEMHPSAKQWITDNQEKFENWKNPPLFMQDNPGYIKRLLE